MSQESWRGEERRRDCAPVTDGEDVTIKMMKKAKEYLEYENILLLFN